jgi:hypothetical protein
LNTGFFDDVCSEVEDTPDRPNGKTVIFIISEKRLLPVSTTRGLSPSPSPIFLPRGKIRKWSSP